MRFKNPFKKKRVALAYYYTFMHVCKKKYSLLSVMELPPSLMMTTSFFLRSSPPAAIACRLPSFGERPDLALLLFVDGVGRQCGHEAVF